MSSWKSSQIESVSVNARLLTEKLMQVLDKADDNDDGRARHP
jgi:hypothetical protein